MFPTELCACISASISQTFGISSRLTVVRRESPRASAQPHVGLEQCPLSPTAPLAGDAERREEHSCCHSPKVSSRWLSRQSQNCQAVPVCLCTQLNN